MMFRLIIKFAISLDCIIPFVPPGLVTFQGFFCYRKEYFNEVIVLYFACCFDIIYFYVYFTPRPTMTCVTSCVRTKDAGNPSNDCYT